MTKMMMMMMRRRRRRRMMVLMMMFRYLGRDQRMTPPESPRESAHNNSSQVKMVMVVNMVVLVV